MKPFALCGYALDKNSEYVTTINRLDNGQYPRYITVKDELSDKYLSLIHIYRVDHLYRVVLSRELIKLDKKQNRMLSLLKN